VQALDVTVVVPAFHAEATLADCVASLLAQDFAGAWELIVVVSGVADDADLGLPFDPRLTVVRRTERRRAAAARNDGVAQSRGRLLAFTDADVVASPAWLRLLVQASDGGMLAVAGSVVNGTPASNMGTVEYLVEFLDFHSNRPSRTAWHGATCNLLVPRRIWEQFGPFPEDLSGGEDTLMTVELRSRGLFTFTGSASVTHRNRTRFGAVMRHQYEFGLFTARVGRRTRAYKMGFLVRHTALAPIATAGRLVSLYGRVAAWDRDNLGRAVRLAPGILAALLAWGVGLFREGLRLDLSHSVTTRG
jgi:glycosyltransferase involved in cell wall biosynthesis